MISGRSVERTSLAWWRTSQLAIGVALVFAKFSTDRTVFGWVATGLAVIVAVVTWLVARYRARDDDDPTRAPKSLRGPMLAVSGICVLLAVSVLAYTVSVVL